MWVREDHEVVAVDEVDDAVGEALDPLRPEDRHPVLAARVGTSGIRPREDVLDPRLDRVDELDCEEPSLLRIPVDGSIEFRDRLGALASAQRH